MQHEADVASATAGAAASVLVRFVGAGVSIGPTRILDDVTLEIGAGAPLVLLGPNGAGKTTLLKLAMGLSRPTSGRVEVAAAQGRAPLRTAFVFQKPVMLRRSTAANVAFALRAAGEPADPGRVTRLLAQVGLTGLGERPARRLSGGEQQRLALARALARRPELLLLDEPTANLDPSATRSVEEVVAHAAGAGVTVVMATHDLGQARRLGGRVALLVKGRIAEAAPAEQFFSAPQSEAARRFLAGDLVL